MILAALHYDKELIYKTFFCIAFSGTDKIHFLIFTSQLIDNTGGQYAQEYPAAKLVSKAITNYLVTRLKLKVNKAKSGY